MHLNKVKFFIGNYFTAICRKQIVINFLFHRYFRLSRHCRNLPFLLGRCARCFSNICTTFRAGGCFHFQRSSRVKNSSLKFQTSNTELPHYRNLEHNSLSNVANCRSIKRLQLITLTTTNHAQEIVS